MFWIVSGRANGALFLSQRRTNPISYFNPNDHHRPDKRFDPINEHIRYPEVLVIGPNGEQLGRMSSYAANEKAMSYNLDLYCVAPQANPPVCKILNYGKFRFEQQKQDRLARKNHKASETKEIQLTPVIGIHDLETKAKQAHGFLEDGSKVQVVVVFRGRQLSHKEVGEEVMKRFLALVADVSSVDKAPFWEEKLYSVILAPKKKIGG